MPDSAIDAPTMLAPDQYPSDTPESRATRRGTITIETREHELLHGLYLALYRADMWQISTSQARDTIMAGVDALTRYYDGADPRKVRQ